MNRNIAILLCLVFVLVYTFIEYSLSPAIFNISYLYKTLFVVAASTALFSITKEQNKILKKQYIRGSYLFLIGFCLVHFQIYFDFVLGNIDSLNLGYSLNYSIINKAALTSTMALVSFYIGYVYKMLKPEQNNNKISPKVYQTRYLYYLCYFCFLLFVLTVNPDYIMGRAYGLIRGTTNAVGGIIPTYAQSYFLFCVYGIILTTTYNIRKREKKFTLVKYLTQFNKIYLAILLLFILMITLSGDRGPIIRIAIALFAGYILQSRKKIKISFIVILLIIASTFFSILGHYRATDNSMDISERYSNAVANSELSKQQNSIFPSGLELARVVRSFHAAYSSVERDGIRGGEGILLQTLGIVPGLGLIYINITGRDGTDIGTASIITREMGADHGMGTTAVADIYFDFGLTGVIVGFLLFGILLRHLDNKLYNQSVPTLWIYVLGFSYIIASVYIGRSSAITPLRDASLTYIFIYIANKFEKYT